MIRHWCRWIVVAAGFRIIVSPLQAQTGEQSLPSTAIGSTVISGYGNARYQHDASAGTATMTLERFVLFAGHRFSNTISLFSELEVEDAKVEGGETGGEVAIEQAYIRFDLGPYHYITAGLFIPRIGILNEDHLPNTFNGNERTLVETYVIPATWRELGVGLYGLVPAGPLEYTVALVNGLNSAGFEHGTLIREGRAEGRNASANSLAVTGSLRYPGNPFQVQISAYYGGTVGMSAREADSLGLTSGVFGTPVFLGEANVQFRSGGWTARALGTIVRIPNASAVNDAFANNTPELAFGSYVEVAWDIFTAIPAFMPSQLLAFVRLERFDLNSRVPVNGVYDGTLNQRHIVAGFTYLPDPGVAVKADMRFAHANVPADPRGNTFVNLGIAFSF